MVHNACLVCLFSTVNGHRKKAKNALGRGGARSRHTAKLKQSRFSLDIFGCNQNEQDISNRRFVKLKVWLCETVRCQTVVVLKSDIGDQQSRP